MVYFNRASEAWTALQAILFSLKRRNKRRTHGTFHAALLFAVWFAGCNSTCFTFSSSPPTSTITVKASDPSASCRLTTVNGAVRVQMSTGAACSSCAASVRVQHIFLTMRGIEVHPSTTAGDDSPDWQELLPPELAKHPLQVDLVTDTAGRGTREPLGGIVAIPAGIYRQVRLHFAELPTDEQLPEKNACGNGVFNCVVMEDGRIQPLRIGGGSPEVRITSDRIEGASLFIPPDTDTDLVIELKVVWAWFSSTGGGVHLLPVLTGSAKAERIEPD